MSTQKIDREAIKAARSGKFSRGDRVRKVGGSQWEGIVVGEYSTTLTPEGYAVESCAHAGSVQIYPAKALELVSQDNDCAGTGHAKQQETDHPEHNLELVGQAIRAAVAAERQEIIKLIPGGDIVDPQLVCDMIRQRGEDQSTETGGGK